MKNLNSLFAAYMAAWAIFSVFYLTVAGRVAGLRRDLDRLKKTVPENK